MVLKALAAGDFGETTAASAVFTFVGYRSFFATGAELHTFPDRRSHAHIAVFWVTDVLQIWLAAFESDVIGNDERPRSKLVFHNIQDRQVRSDQPSNSRKSIGLSMVFRVSLASPSRMVIRSDTPASAKVARDAAILPCSSRW